MQYLSESTVKAKRVCLRSLFTILFADSLRNITKTGIICSLFSFNEGIFIIILRELSSTYTYINIIQKIYYSHIPNTQAQTMSGETKRNSKNIIPPIASQSNGLSQKPKGFWFLVHINSFLFLDLFFFFCGTKQTNVLWSSFCWEYMLKSQKMILLPTFKALEETPKASGVFGAVRLIA